MPVTPSRKETICISVMFKPSAMSET